VSLSNELLFCNLSPHIISSSSFAQTKAVLSKIPIRDKDLAMTDPAPEDPEVASAPASLQPPAESTAAEDYANNKWSKNGFGANVPSSKQTGKFTKAESEIIRQSIEQFCAAKQISVARLCSECDHKAELKGAWMEIAKCLPHRSVQSVYRHGIRRCHPFKRGGWTEAETVSLADLVQRLGKKWSAIQSKLNRSADSCRDKYREMSEEFVKGRWREQETELLKRYIREQLNAPVSIVSRKTQSGVGSDSRIFSFFSLSHSMNWRFFAGYERIGQASGRTGHSDSMEYS
jgi:hypothetical protein